MVIVTIHVVYKAKYHICRILAVQAFYRLFLVLLLKLLDFWFQSILIRVITKLPNSEQSSEGKVNSHKYINRLLLSMIYV